MSPLHTIKPERPNFNRNSLIWISYTSCTNLHYDGDGFEASSHHTCVRRIFKDLMTIDDSAYYCTCGNCVNYEIRHYFLTKYGNYVCQYCLDSICPTIPQEYLNG